MKREQIISIFFIALLVFIIIQTVYIFSPFTRAIFWSSILAFTFYPVYSYLLARLKMHEGIIAAIVTILIILIVVPPVIILAVNLTSQAIELYQSTVNYIRTGELQIIIDKIRTVKFIQNIEENLFRWDIVRGSLENWILTSTKSFGNFTAAQVGAVTKNVVMLTLNAFFMTFLVFVFLKDGGKIYRFLHDIAPLEEKNRDLIFGQINETFAAVIRGQLLTSLAQAALTGTMFWILGLPVPLLFGAAAFITALIPVVGASGIWFPMVIYLFFQHEIAKAVILFLFGVLVISIADNILKPMIIGEKTRLPYFLLFFGILGGLQIYGFMGIFLAPAVLSLFFALIKIYQEQYK